MLSLSEDLRRFAREKGADLIGVAPIERFKYAPYGAKPEDLLPGAGSVVSMAIWLTDTALDVWDCTHAPYQLAAHLVSNTLNTLSLYVAKFLEKRQYRALLFPATEIGMRAPYDREEGFVQGARVSEFSHRHAAVAAGLGEFGYHSCLLTPEYGPRVRVTSIITDAQLKPDELYQGPKLCTDCYKCVDACPMNAISKTKTVKVRYPGRTYEYAVIDFSRCHWGQSLGLHPEAGSWHIGLKPPKHIDSKVLHRYSQLYPKGRNRQICGLCMVFCSSRTGKKGKGLKIREIPGIYKKSALYCPGGILNTITVDEVVGRYSAEERPCDYGQRDMNLHRYDREGISIHRESTPAWKRDKLLESTIVKDWVYHLGSDEKKLSYLARLKEFLEFIGETPEELMEGAICTEKFGLDNKLKEFLEYLGKERKTEDKCVEYYLGVRSFFVWNGLIEKLRAVPRKFKKVVATGVYDYHKSVDE